MSSTALIILPLFILFWFFCIASAVFNKFKNEKAKVFWIIGLIFVPFLSFFYIFLKKDLLED
ncbi:MAG: PLDc N-terminal domain-containing protein [Arcobacteraceae bacterium]|nr:PLDc N-terminal domain-containing protein [Arcobacteraceae bacterium]